MNTVSRVAILLLCSGLVTSACDPAAGADAPLPRSEGPAGAPNLVILLADDLGWADLGVYGSTFHETPHLDGLAAEGVLFTQAYTAGSVCSPSRASLLTGRYPARIHQTDWIPGQGDEPHQMLLQVRDHDELPLDEVTIAEALRGAGYRTAHIGKWHLGREGHRPAEQGFDVVVGVNDYGSPPTYFWPYEGGNRDLEELTATGRPGENLTERLAEEAARFIAANRERPFFLYLPFYAPHTPLEARPALIEKYERKAARLGLHGHAVLGTEGGNLHRRIQSDPVYAGMIETLDGAVGRVLRSLEENGVAERTLVVFLSDNGGLAVLEAGWGEPPTSNLPLRAGKGWLYEGGVRGPFIVRWPGIVTPGAVEEAPVITNDILPTLLEVAGVQPGLAPAHDGLSLVPLLRRGQAPDRDEFFWHYPHYHGSGHRPAGAIRRGDHKLILWYEHGRTELYDLHEDPGERLDLSRTRPDVVAALRPRLERWLDSIDAQRPVPNPDYVGTGGPR